MLIAARGRRFHAAILIASISSLVLICGPVAGQEQRANSSGITTNARAEGPVSVITPQIETGSFLVNKEPRQLFEREIARLEAAIAELERLEAFQQGLTAAAASNPASTRGQRRSYAECISSPLASLCEFLEGMYAGAGP